MPRLTRADGWAITGPAVGLAFGLVVVLTADTRAPLWMVWAPLAVTLSTAAGLTPRYGWRRWKDLNAIRTGPAGGLFTPIVGVILVISLLVINVPAFIGGVGWNWRASALTSLAVMSGVPVAGVMYGVRSVAAATALSPTPGAQLASLIALRRLLQQLLGAVGALVTLATLHAGALLALERSLHSQFGDRPPESVLVFGGVGSAIVAAAYVPAWAALRERGTELCDKLFSTEGLEEASAILTTAANHRTLAEIVGADRSILADFQSGIFVVAPVIAGTVGAFVPH